MEEQQERQPLLNSAGTQCVDIDCLESAVSFQEQDSDNPMEWSQSYKWFSVGLLCMFGAVVTYTCIGIIPVANDVVKELKGQKDRSAAVLFITIWELGEAIGPLLVAPLSELYGRFIVYNVANCLFVAGVTGAALSQNIKFLIFARFATGCAVASGVLNPAIIGDMFPKESRGTAMSAVLLAPLIGGALGPTTSGVLAEAKGWRAVIWVSVVVAGVMEVLLLTLFRETYPPTILRRRAAGKCNQIRDGNQNTITVVIQSILRPMRIIWSSSMLQCLSLWSGVMFSFFYVNSTSLPEILEVIYEFGPSMRGLSYLAWSLGSLIGNIICNRGIDKICNNLSKRYGKFRPEGRLPLAIVGAFLLPLAVTLYGWTAQAHTPVLVFLATSTLLCISIAFSIVPVMTFITDAFGIYSASAITATLTARCLLGACLPLAVPHMAQNIGYGWALTVMAAVTLAMAPIPCMVMRYGPVWRQRSEYSSDK